MYIQVSLYNVYFDSVKEVEPQLVSVSPEAAVIVAIVLSSVAGLLIIVGVAVWCVRYQRRRKEREAGMGDANGKPVILPTQVRSTGRILANGFRVTLGVGGSG